MIKAMKKYYGYATLFCGLFLVSMGTANATPAAYFSLPTDFEENITLTLTSIAGSILVILGLMFAWRKTVKSVNRS